MKKTLIILCNILCVACLFSFSACGIFGDNEQSGNNSKANGKIGQTLVNSDGVSICLVNVEDTKRLGTEYLYDTTENNFILLTIKVTNNSKKEQTFYNSCAELYNSNNIKYEAATSIYINYILMEDIGVGITKTFQVVFETPTTTKQEKYTVKIGYSSYTPNSNKVIFDLEY